MAAEEFKLLLNMIEKDSAITLREEKLYLLESRLRPLLAEFSADTFGDLYRLAENNSHPLVRQKIIDAITTNETFWFRDKSPFAILEEVFLPVAVKLIKRGRPRVRIWSAACSTVSYPTRLLAPSLTRSIVRLRGRAPSWSPSSAPSPSPAPKAPLSFSFSAAAAAAAGVGRSPPPYGWSEAVGDTPYLALTMAASTGNSYSRTKSDACLICRRWEGEGRTEGGEEGKV